MSDFPFITVGRAAADIGCGHGFLVALIQSGRVRGEEAMTDGRMQWRLHLEDYESLMAKSLREY